MGTETGEYRCEEAGNQPGTTQEKPQKPQTSSGPRQQKKPEIEARKNLKVRLELFLCIFDAY